MLPYPLTDFEIQKCYENKPKFNGVYSRNDSSKIKDWKLIINLDEYELIGTHWITLYINDHNVTYFDSFGVEHIPKEIKKFIANKNIITNIYRIQAYDSVMCGHFCIGFIDFILKGKSLLEYTNLFYFKFYFIWKEWQNNIKIFSIKSNKVKCILMFVIKLKY